MRSFTRHVFGTLTYARDIEILQCWQKISKDFNRFFQEFRRLHPLAQVHYLRVIEEHKDGYPHIHVIIQFDSACISVDADRYFDRTVYQKWKSLWRHGHSDYQQPRRNGVGTLSYVMKYLLKNRTYKSIWKKVLSARTVEKPISDPITSSECSNTSQTIIKQDQDLMGEDFIPSSTRLNGVKLCTWSRGFDFTPFSRSSFN